MITNCVVHKVILLNHASVGLPVAAVLANFVFMQSLSGLCASSKLSLTQTTESLRKLQRFGATRPSDSRTTRTSTLSYSTRFLTVKSWIIEGGNSFIQKLLRYINILLRNNLCFLGSLTAYYFILLYRKVISASKFAIL